MTTAQLEDLSFEVLEAENTEKALSRVEARDDIDVVLSAVAMAEIKRVARRRAPSPSALLPISFMIGHADRGRLMGEPMFDKTFRSAGLLAALAESPRPRS